MSLNIELQKPEFQVRVWDAYWQTWVAIPSDLMPYEEAVMLALVWADDWPAAEVQVYRDSPDGLVLMGSCEWEDGNPYQSWNWRNDDNGFVFKEVF